MVNPHIDSVARDGGSFRAGYAGKGYGRALDAHDAEKAGPASRSLTELPTDIDKTLAEPDAEDDEYVYWPN